MRSDAIPVPPFASFIKHEALKATQGQSALVCASTDDGERPRPSARFKKISAFYATYAFAHTPQEERERERLLEILGLSDSSSSFFSLGFLSNAYSRSPLFVSFSRSLLPHALELTGS